MTAIPHTLQSVEGGKITGRNLGDGVLQATERAQLCEVTIPRGTQHPGLVGRPQGGAARDRVTLIISCAVGAQPQRCWVMGAALCCPVWAPRSTDLGFSLDSSPPHPCPPVLPRCQPAVPTLTRRMLRGFLYSSHTDGLLPKFGSKH